MCADDNSLLILMADDDEDDCLLAKKALEQSNLAAQLRFVKDGEALMDYLNRQGTCEQDDFPKPDIILLDLNMPKMNGIEALKAIKSHELLCCIPVIMLTTSRADQDVCSSYAFGANSFITKPASFKGLVETMDIIKRYWFEIVELPKKHAV